jgi:acetyltransferase-like isoleucine patch superfamily enzyme
MKKYFADPRGYLFSYIDRILNRLYLWFSTITSKLIFYLRGVKLGTNIKFYGLAKVSRMALSKIEISDSCTFRSDQTSNLIGVNHKCILSTHSKSATIKIGNNCGFSGTTVGAILKIEIGNNVLCGANTVITDFDWHTDRYNIDAKPIIISDNVWLGLNAVVLKGVTIGENAIIGANSVVVKDIPANTIAAGNPCKVLKYLNSSEN